MRGVTVSLFSLVIVGSEEEEEEDEEKMEAGELSLTEPKGEIRSKKSDWRQIGDFTILQINASKLCLVSRCSVYIYVVTESN